MSDFNPFNSPKIVAQWNSPKGLRCCVINNSQPNYPIRHEPYLNHWFCGYVEVPNTHPLYREDVPSEGENLVNGGLTFGKTDENATIFGFDTVHSFNETIRYTESMTIEEVEKLAEFLEIYPNNKKEE